LGREFMGMQGVSWERFFRVVIHGPSASPQIMKGLVGRGLRGLALIHGA
jgi:hypothetical protein